MEKTVIQTYTSLAAANAARQAEWPGADKADLAFRGLELAGEAGEACNIMKKLERQRRGIQGSTSNLAALGEELADVVISAYLCAFTAGIDLDACIPSKFNRTSEAQGLATRLAQSPLSEFEITELRGAVSAAAKILAACDWHWPHDDHDSEACASSAREVAENVELEPGDVLQYDRGGIVETRYYAFLPPAHDSESNDIFEVDEDTEAEAAAIIAAELERRHALKPKP